MTGDVREPKGIPFLWTEISQGKYITSIDVTEEEHTPVYTEHTRTEVDLLQEQVDDGRRKRRNIE